LSAGICPDRLEELTASWERIRDREGTDSDGIKMVEGKRKRGKRKGKRKEERKGQGIP